MNHLPLTDPNDWRTWPREGRRLFPPLGTTAEQAIAATDGFSLACWGIDPEKPRKDRRNVIRVLKKMDGGYVQVRYDRVVDGRGDPGPGSRRLPVPL